LHRDGRLTNPRPVGGARNGTFEDAVVGALVTLDGDRLLPPGDSIDFDHDTLDVRLTITPSVITNVSVTPPPVHTPGVTPLFRLRLPVRPFESDVAAALPDNPRPRYPQTMWEQGIEGEVRAEFVVRGDGSVDVASIQISKATRAEFASAVVTTIPAMRFYPTQISGCNVSRLVQMPFVFGLSR
jgi:TonB family protein